MQSCQISIFFKILLILNILRHYCVFILSTTILIIIISQQAQNKIEADDIQR